jgi:Tubulin like
MAAVSLEEKLQKRKLDALKNGVHRIRANESAAFGVHVIGLGRAGCEVVAQVIARGSESLVSDERARFTALAIDVDPRALEVVEAARAALPADRAQVETLALGLPTTDALQASLQRQPEFLRLEYPLYSWNPHYQPWISNELKFPDNAGHFPRALAKALYSKAYYDAPRTMASALRKFAQSVDATPVESVVCIVFGLTGGIGSGLAVDLARHLSNVIFGHRVVVVGIGIAPCDGDYPAHDPAQLFPVLTELDCMSDERKNRGVTAAFGELHRNPFTGGFLVVPQQHVWQTTKDLQVTQQRIDRELATLLTANRGAQLWETLRLLNWVAAPSTQHSAARTPYGAQWLHLWSFVDQANLGQGGATLRKQLGVRTSYKPEFIELRAPNPDDRDVAKIAANIDEAFTPEVTPAVAPGGGEGSVQFILPRLRKTDLDLFFAAQHAYDAQSPAAKLLEHSWLLDLGIVLSEPSTRLEGMAGASLWGGENWVAVPYDLIRIAEEDRLPQTEVKAKDYVDAT